MDQRFSFGSLKSRDTAERQRLLGELEQELCASIDTGDAFFSSVNGVVSGLNALGHGLACFDESSDFSVWSVDYSKGKSEGLVLTFSRDGLVEVEWSS